MITRRGFVKNAIAGGTAVAVCPNLLSHENTPALLNESESPPENIANCYRGLKSPQNYVIVKPGDLYIRDTADTQLYIHTGSTSNNTEWVFV